MKNKIIVLVILVVVIGAVVLLPSNNKEGSEDVMMDKHITSFEECVEAGFPVMESYPEQCRTDSGELFVRELEDNEQPDEIDEPNTEDEPGYVACTADALICPDGSGVGRVGPNCTFAACPNQEYFLGVLRKENDQYVVTQENYTIPIVFKAENILGYFVNQEVKVYGKFTEGNTLSVSTVEKYDPTRDVLSVGETKTINGLTITLTDIDDSRCPSDVQCVQAGTVIAYITVRDDSSNMNLEISYAEEGLSFEDRTISLMGVEPTSITSTDNVPKSSYKLDFKVE